MEVISIVFLCVSLFVAGVGIGELIANHNSDILLSLKNEVESLKRDNLSLISQINDYISFQHDLELKIDILESVNNKISNRKNKRKKE